VSYPRGTRPLKLASSLPLRMLAGFLLSLASMSCLPPDYEIAPAPNAPVAIQKELLPVSPDVFHRLGGCPPPPLELDVIQALDNPDGDRLFSAWLVNHVPGQGGRPDVTSTTSPSPYVFDPCTNPKVRTGAAINTIEFVVLDRAPASFDDGDGVRTVVDPETTSTNVVWFVGVDDLGCCGVPP
jgi:hypothetical protein